MYVGEGGIAFSEQNSEKAVIDTMKGLSDDDPLVSRRKQVSQICLKTISF